MSKVKVTEWVSQWVSEWQGHLLSCCGQLKSVWKIWYPQKCERYVVSIKLRVICKICGWYDMQNKWSIWCAKKRTKHGDMCKQLLTWNCKKNETRLEHCIFEWIKHFLKSECRSSPSPWSWCQGHARGTDEGKNSDSTLKVWKIWKQCSYKSQRTDDGEKSKSSISRGLSKRGMI